VHAKTLLVDPESGLLTALLRMEPGAVLPDHEHVLIEQTYVIEGSLDDAEGSCTAGNFVWRPAGTRHEAYAPTGNLCLAIFQVPNKFFREGDAEQDMLGRDWSAFWGEAANIGPQA
jgi:anti-sigma factor ChrR (cupin superfamily)